MATEGFPESVAALRAELRRLEGELKRADADGNRRASLAIIGQMIATQKEFMNRWPTSRREESVAFSSPTSPGSGKRSLP